MKRATSSGGGSGNNHQASQPTSNAPSQSSLAIAASQSLQLLLREDHLLTQHELHQNKGSEEASFSYAAALLQHEGGAVQQRATEALGEVDRKLALVQSLAERVSRTSPEAVAGPLLRLHGYNMEEKKDEGEQDGDATTDLMPRAPHTTQASTLLSTRERCHRLQRQSEVMEGVAKRVELSLKRGLKRMETATARLDRVLSLSATLKMILRLQFESSKLQGYDLEDLRDLTRAAASVAIIEDLLNQVSKKEEPDVVKAMRPQAESTATTVRRAAAALLEQHQSGTGVIQLGATLQVYYHLGELPEAAWSAVEYGLKQALQASKEFWSPGSISALVEKANAQAKAASKTESAYHRNLQKRLRELRAEASSSWSNGVSKASLQVWNLQRVLSHKSDPISRQVFLEVVSAAPVPTKFVDGSDGDFSVFSLFWKKLCNELGKTLGKLLENEKVSSDVASLYPAVRSATIAMLGSLHDTMIAGSSKLSLDDSSGSAGVLGGSSALDDAYWARKDGVATSADTWTRSDSKAEDSPDQPFASTTTTSLSAVFQSNEWKSMQNIGLYPLQQAFLKACRSRLCGPIQFMFPEGVNVDENGVAMTVLPALPSRYDMQKLDQNIRTELSTADPREGGGDLSMTTMIAEVVVDMVGRFCERAKNAVSNVGEEYCLTDDGKPTSNMIHDLKVANVMNTLANAVKNAPENTFIVPYRPATSVQHEEAANLCNTALVPALQQIEKTAKKLILSPLCRALNRRILSAIARVHHGTYLEESVESSGGGTSFVQKHLTVLYGNIADQHLSKLPPDYASYVAATIISFSIYTFVSNVSLVRPLGESVRMRVTQDLADFEYALEDLASKANNAMSLSQVEHGKPYGELRAVRQMLFWQGLEDKSLSASSLAKSMLREVWVKDVRPSTVFHFLFSSAPTLLSSPHHSKRMRPEDYVSSLVQLNGSTDDGEAIAWMTTLACCDSYQQRETVDGGGRDGDRRIAALLMMLGPELLRRRRA